MKTHDHEIREALLLPNHHVRMEGLLDELRAAARVDDRIALQEVWDRLEETVLDHIGAEEKFLLPDFAKTHLDEATVIRSEHDDIRRLLDDLGVSVDLKRLNAGVADQLSARLREHARREDEVLYPWAQSKLAGWPHYRDALIR